MRQFIDEDIMDDIVVISEATLEVLRGKAIDILKQLRKQSPNIKCNVYIFGGWGDLTKKMTYSGEPYTRLRFKASERLDGSILRLVDDLRTDNTRIIIIPIIPGHLATMNKSLIDEDAELEEQIHSEQYELQRIIRDVNDGIVALNEEAGLVTPWVNKKIFRVRRANGRCYFFPYFLNYDGLHFHRVLPTLKHI